MESQERARKPGMGFAVEIFLLSWLPHGKILGKLKFGSLNCYDKQT
ncbi:MAG: hypothetical protein V3T91_01100 [Candidatus Bipolaricaulota bacterium]